MSTKLTLSSVATLMTDRYHKWLKDGVPVYCEDSGDIKYTRDPSAAEMKVMIDWLKHNGVSVASDQKSELDEMREMLKSQNIDGGLPALETYGEDSAYVS